MYNIELTEYQKEMIGDKKWYFSKVVLLALFINLLAVLCCYVLLFVDNSFVNLAKFGLVLYVVGEIAGILVFSIFILATKIITYARSKIRIEERLDLEDKYDKIFSPFYKLIPRDRSWVYYFVDVGFDTLIFVTFVMAGWFVTAIIHVACVVLTLKLKRSFNATLLSNLKKRTSPESPETIDELADKLFNG